VTTERRLAAAIVASLALHTAAWQLVPPLRAQIPPLVRTLEVLLVARPSEPPAPVVEAVPPPPPARSEPVARRPRAVERRPRAVERESRPIAPVEEAAAPREPAPAPETAPPAQAQPAPAIPARPAEPAAVAALAAPPPEILAGYGSRVSRLLARHREYPRVALMRGWEGTVTMRLRVAPGGRLIEASVQGSSGHQVLDAQALDMVKRVPELPTPPESLRDREFAVLVPVVFRLER
jgi:protein TonB